MQPHDFTWYQRGSIDYLIGVSFSASPAPDLFERDEWEKGWLAQAERERARRVRVTGNAEAVLRQGVRAHS